MLNTVLFLSEVTPNMISVFLNNRIQEICNFDHGILKIRSFDMNRGAPLKNSRLISPLSRTAAADLKVINISCTAQLNIQFIILININIY